MIATLNQMPTEPCIFMKQWLLLHFYDKEHADIIQEHTLVDASPKKNVIKSP